MLTELQQYISKSLTDFIINVQIAYGELNVTVTREAITDVLLFLKNDSKCQFISFIDLSGADFPQQPDRFQLSYHLLSPKYNNRIRVKLFTDNSKPVDSICSIYAGAEWYEREVYDMYGVLFSGHPDMRRILTDYGFEGYPLRKDFPVTGFVECRYDSEQAKILYEPVVLRQEMRIFDNLSPWSGYPEKYKDMLCHERANHQLEEKEEAKS